MQKHLAYCIVVPKTGILPSLHAANISSNYMRLYGLDAVSFWGIKEMKTLEKTGLQQHLTGTSPALFLFEETERVWQWLNSCCSPAGMSRGGVGGVSLEYHRLLARPGQRDAVHPVPPWSCSPDYLLSRSRRCFLKMS